ncbi:unnamed protein product, partial [Prorocentrum cordatum]
PSSGSRHGRLGAHAAAGQGLRQGRGSHLRVAGRRRRRPGGRTADAAGRGRGAVLRGERQPLEDALRVREQGRHVRAGRPDDPARGAAARGPGSRGARARAARGAVRGPRSRGARVGPGEGAAASWARTRPLLLLLLPPPPSSSS